MSCYIPIRTGIYRNRLRQQLVGMMGLLCQSICFYISSSENFSSLIRKPPGSLARPVSQSVSRENLFCKSCQCCVKICLNSNNSDLVSSHETRSIVHEIWSFNPFFKFSQCMLQWYMAFNSFLHEFNTIFLTRQYLVLVNMKSRVNLTNQIHNLVMLLQSQSLEQLLR